MEPDHPTLEEQLDAAQGQAKQYRKLWLEERRARKRESKLWTEWRDRWQATDCERVQALNRVRNLERAAEAQTENMMLKNYGNKYSNYGGYAMQHKVGPDLKDVDERLNRLERLVRATVLDPAGVPVGAALHDAVAKVTINVEAQSQQEDELYKAPSHRNPEPAYRMSLTEARKEVRALRRDVIRLTGSNKVLQATLDARSKELADAKDAYWREKIGRTKDKNEWDERVRQFVEGTKATA